MEVWRLDVGVVTWKVKEGLEAWTSGFSTLICWRHRALEP